MLNSRKSEIQKEFEMKRAQYRKIYQSWHGEVI